MINGQLATITDRRQIDTGTPAKLEADVDFNIADDIFVKQMVAKEGTWIQQHKHTYDHTTMLASGQVRLWIDDAWSGDFVAPMPIHVAAGKAHSFLAMTDTVLFCIHRIREEDEGVSIMKEKS